MLTQLPHDADAVFEGGGVKGIAFAGAVRAVEDAGVREWCNVAGTSAGAIVASLLVAGYRADDLERIMTVDYRRFADYGVGGVARGLLNSLWMRGLAPGRFFERWLEQHLADSPLGRSLGGRQPTFADVRRTDLPASLSDAQRERVLYRLQVIASDITAGRMLVLPHDIASFSLSRNGPRVDPEELTLVQAVRMSMSFPFLYNPVTLWDGDRPHYVVDGGLLSNFPVWLFDSGGERPPVRPTWGFRLHGGWSELPEQPQRRIPLPLWRLALARAMFSAATEAWDRDRAARTQAVRTIDIPTGDVGTTDFDLADEAVAFLRDSGADSAARFMALPATVAYLKQFDAGPEALAA